ncbi:hypothetical protein Glove_279g31 [Diversispora epigaea]|uniref:Uncharacterized protein n=1 Tax=Diversispora epigaea TaxID=1348612 RepID=A0A397I2A6_9GLOM|nr:hypothetical protein Glove_279g31 [Diversispora epigaea]
MKYHLPFNLAIKIIIFLSVRIAFLPNIEAEALSAFKIRISGNVILSVGSTILSSDVDIKAYPCILSEQYFYEIKRMWSN